MDKVKVYLRILRKHLFWVLSSLAVLFGLICWWMGANSLASTTAANRSKIEGTFSSLDGVSRDRPPNATFAEGVKNEHVKLEDRVLAEWQAHYDQQQELFKWPALVQKISTTNPADEIPDDLRKLYKQNVFPSALHDLYKLANARIPKEKDATVPKPAPGGKPAPAVNPEDEDVDGPTVVWDSGHRASLETRYDLRNIVATTISSTNVRTAQEDMWVLQQLAQIIRKTNEGASDRLALPVKRIDSLEIAQWAIEESQKNPTRLRLGDPKPVEGATTMATMGGTAAAADGAAPPTAAEVQARLDTELLDGRYLSDLGEPLLSADPPPFSEFKLMFVRMKLLVDQRKLPDLLVNCANSKLPIDVLRVRMDEPVGTQGGAAAVAHAAPQAGQGMGSLQGGMNTSGNEARPASSGGSTSDDAVVTHPYDVPVEICGVVQIYNPPNKEKLAGGSAADPNKRPSGVPVGKVQRPRTKMVSGGMGGPIR